MKLGLIGFPQVGKRTLFRLLTGKESEPENGKGEVQGLARVRDERFERLEKERGRNGDARRAAQEKELLNRMKDHLEGGRFLSTFPFTDEEQKLVSAYIFLTRKPMILILNIGEDQLRSPGLTDQLAADFPGQAFQWIAVSAKIEEELSRLDEEERQAFLEEMNIAQPALDRLTLVCYRTLGLISFFTVGPDEVRAWTNRKESPAPRAARVIHSDIERGFIRAEVIKYEDLIHLGNEQKVREAGKLLQKGRDYVVQDGDIINFLFNV